ncbi:MAG TPA: DUF4142 domain-containing protein [Verrucomicrobiae bacterium]|jgi:putative membrane protein
MKKLLVIVLPLALAVGCAHHRDANMGSPDTGTAAQTGKSSSQLSSYDMRFIKEASQGGLAEVQMGQIASQNGESQAVKALGQKLVQDHTAANSELSQIAASKGVDLPKDLDTKHQKELEHFTAAKGGDFDRMFQKHAIADHQKDIRKFQEAAEKASDPEIRAFAQKQLPILQQHLSMAKEAAVGNASGAVSPNSGSSSSTSGSSSSTSGSSNFDPSTSRGSQQTVPPTSGNQPGSPSTTPSTSPSSGQ